MNSLKIRYRALKMKLNSWTPVRRWSAIVCLVWAGLLVLALAGDLAMLLIGWAAALIGTAAGFLAIPAFIAGIVFACTFIPKRKKQPATEVSQASA